MPRGRGRAGGCAATEAEAAAAAKSLGRARMDVCEWLVNVQLVACNVDCATQELRSVKDKPFYCQSSVGTAKRLSVPTFEPYGNGDDDDDDDDRTIAMCA